MPYRIFLKIENVKNQSHFLSFLSEKENFVNFRGTELPWDHQTLKLRKQGRISKNI